MTSKLVDDVAQAIRKLREIQGMSQETLAALSDLDRTYISGVERGVRNITLTSLDKIIVALGVTRRQFFRLATGESIELFDQ